MLKLSLGENMYLVNFEFTFNFGSVIAFLMGIVSGIILFVLIYLLWSLIYLKKQEVVLDDINSDVSTEQVDELIKQSQTKFLQVKKETGEISFDSLRSISFELMNNIASLYYPESKHPLSELTIKELILLDQYLVEKVDNLLSKFPLKVFKKVRMNKIISLLNMKKTIDSNSVIQAGKKIGNFSGKLWALLNFLNPYQWIKRGIYNPSVNFIIKKICLVLIATIGQETYHIYSKQAFLDPVLDKDIEKLIQVIEQQNQEENEAKSKTKVKI